LSTELPPAAGAVRPVGASSPGAAVTTLITSSVDLDLQGLIADLAPGDMAALQRYAPVILSKESAELATAKKQFSAKITGLATTNERLDGMTMVKLKSLNLTATYRGMTITVHGHCITLSSKGHVTNQCTATPQVQKITASLPANLRTAITQLESTRPNFGIMTVEEGGRWFVSPTATLLQGADSLISIITPQFLSTVATFAKNPLQAEQVLSTLERSLLGGRLGTTK
jgi:hypothetical protein